ncbi:hypothetical protein BJV78DRAFT_529133 [Lactifluus subvellereus]|nr:hypothetical protein BJV78DRAFT_529133 [Lactifluus subvellereus]
MVLLSRLIFVAVILSLTGCRSQLESRCMVFGYRRVLVVVVRAISSCAALLRCALALRSCALPPLPRRLVLVGRVPCPFHSGIVGKGHRPLRRSTWWAGGICRSGRERSWLCRGVRELVQVSGLVGDAFVRV